MAAQCVGRVVAYRVTFVLAFHEGVFNGPNLRLCGMRYELGVGIFPFRAAQGLSGSINGLIPGYFARLPLLVSTRAPIGSRDFLN
jgi:hypothetical protein